MTKILFVCSANRDRSPTAEHIYKNHPALEVKSAGVSMYARQPVTKELLKWADAVLCMEERHKYLIMRDYEDSTAGKTVVSLDIGDDYRHFHPDLVKILNEKVDAWLRENLNS